MEVLPKRYSLFMPFSLKVKSSGLPPRDPGAQEFHLFFVIVLCNGFWIQLVGQAGQAVSCV